MKTWIARARPSATKPHTAVASVHPHDQSTNSNPMFTTAGLWEWMVLLEKSQQWILSEVKRDQSPPAISAQLNSADQKLNSVI